MPRSSTLVSPEPVGADAVARAVAIVRDRLGATGESPDFVLQPLDAGAALTVSADGDLVLTVLRPRPLAGLAEARRLRPGWKLDALPTPAFWTDAYTPWTPGGLIGIAGASLATKAKTGSGLKAGPGGLLGLAEGLAFTAIVVSLVVLAFQFADYGYLPNAIPVEGGRCD